MKNYFTRFSLKQKLNIIIIAVFSLTILITGLFMGLSFDHYSKIIAFNHASDINQSFTNRIESEIQKQIVTIKTLSTVLAHFPMIKNLTEDQNQKQMLKAFLLNNEGINSLILSYSVENIIDTLENDSIGITEEMLFFEKKRTEIIENEVLDDDFAQVISQNLPSSESNIAISEPYKGINDNTVDFLIFYSTTFKRVSDNKSGMITVVFSLNQFSHLVNSSVFGNDSKSILLTANNSIVAVSNKPWMTGKNIIKFQGEEHELFTKISSTDQQTTNYKNFVVTIHNVEIPDADFKWRLITSIPIHNITGLLTDNAKFSIIIVLVLMLIGLLLMISLLKRAFYPLNLTTQTIFKVANGNPVKIPKGLYHKEFNDMIEGINRISDNLLEIDDVSRDISEGDMNKRVKMKSEYDILAGSVNKIAENLKQSVIDRRQKEENTDRQLWMRRGRFEVAEAERVSSGKPEDLAFNLIRSIVNYTEAVMGGMYAYDEDTEIVEFVAAYAYGNRKLIRKEFKKGEGLVGTCVIERKKIEMNKIPDDYIKIATGLGSGSPGYLAIIPVFFQDKINSVIEIAYYKKPEDHIIEFIEQLSDSIGGWMDASLKKNKTIELLRISTEQTKKLAEKEDELKTKINELERVQNEIAVKNAEYESMLRAVNHSVMTVKYTIEGVLLEANDVYVKTMGFQREELIGMNVYEFVKGQEEDLRIIIERVSNGETITKQIKRNTKNGELKHLTATYTPYITPDNAIAGVLFFAVEVFHSIN
jgi:PAS domain S-box-containing protein